MRPLRPPLLMLGLIALVGVSTSGATGTGQAKQVKALVVGERLVVSAPWPAAFAFDPSGRIFYGKRFTGQIRIFNPSTLSDTAFVKLPSVSKAGGEQGLLGLALDPAYPTNHFVYAFYSYRNSQVRIVRLTDTSGVGKGLKVILKIPVNSNQHLVGVIHFGSDQRLYAVMGDNDQRAQSQTLSTNRGKVLRMTTLGQAPPDNPFADKLIWSYGLRNSFGFTFDPQTGNLWETENGPECNDELNLIVAGGNYGWGPTETCAGTAPQNTNQDGPNPILPVAFYTPVTAPTGAAFCQGCGLGDSLEGRLIYGDWVNGDLHAVTLTTDRLGVASESVLVDRAPQGVLAVERAPDGGLYFSDPAGIYKLTGS